YMQRVRLRRTALRATPRMNTSTQPPEGAGGSRSRAAGELTLGLMSGEERSVYSEPLVGARLAREGSLTADLFLRMYASFPKAVILLALALAFDVDLVLSPLRQTVGDAP
ncbi:MAG: hypothetical protein Q7T27_18840, partial [Pseudomonas sp.]|uniref:hypothetical protein n=1 Tax=Pseudomonas sp. TaxID=306 RepID=UPI00271F117D